MSYVGAGNTAVAYNGAHDSVPRWDCVVRIHCIVALACDDGSIKLGRFRENDRARVRRR